MRNRQEIIDYLGLWMSEEYVGKEGIEINKKCVKAAERIEQDFAKELAEGTYGYGLHCDFVNTPSFIEDIGYHKLKEIANYDGVIVYQRIEKLRYLFSLKANYIIEIPINEEFHFFVEGLDSNGCTNTHKEFNIDNIKNFCIEVIDSDGEYVETIDNIGVTLDTTIEELKERVLC